MPHALAILLLAAGASSRMQGGDKLLEKIAHQPLLSHLVQQAQATGFQVLVTVPDLAHPRAALTGPAQCIPVPDAAEGMGASIRTGIRALPDRTEGVMILPADMPELTTANFQKLADGFAGPEGAILRATGQDGTGAIRAGHPVLFPRRCFDALLRLKGDDGARRVLQGENVTRVPLPASHALTDLDTPDAWATWRAGQTPG